ncbi:MAG: hypothetical protein HQM00_11205 [Magnetococcales bacterium]|nr:hypothetical protein [Magnetococcales bacterium]
MKTNTIRVLSGLKRGKLLSSTLPTLMLCVAFGIAFPGCGGGGGGGGSSGTTGTTVVAQDGNIVGLVVKDSSSPQQTATDQGNGEYRFANTAVTPIVGSSNNTLDNDGVVTGTVRTFQDLDGDGLYTTNVDIPYNSNLTVAYANNPNVVKMNPVTALVPATWNGSSSVAGLSAAVVQYALNNGVPPSTDTSTQAPIIRSVAAKLTAIQENLIQMGANKERTDDLLQAMGADSSSTVNLDGGSGALETAFKYAIDSSRVTVGNLFSGGVTEAQLETAVTKLTTALDSAASSVAPTHPESFVGALTNAVGALLSGSESGSRVSTIQSATLPDLADAMSDWDSAITSGVNSGSVTLATLFSSLYIMPVYDLGTTSNTNVAPVDGTLAELTDFAISYSATNRTVTLSGDGGFEFLGKSLTYSSDDLMYGWASSNEDDAAAINLNYAGFRLFSYTTDGGSSMHLFSLVKQSEICGFTFTDGKKLSEKTGVSGQTLLDEIKEMNAATLQCSAS